MHLIGDSMIVYAVLPSQDTVPLIRINEWDFHWQGGYRFQYLQPIPVGSVLEAFAHYDNTVNNPHNPNNPPEDVWVGEATTDEMMLVYFQYTPYQNGDQFILQDSSLLQTGTLPLMPGTGRLQVFPSPADAEFSVALESSTAQEAVLEVWDMSGKAVLVRPMSLASGANRASVPAAHLPQGIYYVVVRGKSGKWMERVVVGH
jgi:hypothetical protein